MTVIADTTIHHPEDFRLEYNRFLRGMSKAYKAIGNLDRAYALRFWWNITELPFDTKTEALEILVNNTGKLVIICNDEELTSAFQEFWRKCKGRYEIENQTTIEQTPENSIEQELDRKDKEKLAHCRRAISAKISEGTSLKQYAESIPISYEALSDWMRKFERMGLIARDYRKRPKK